jgi:hypothetical protein
MRTATSGQPKSSSTAPKAWKAKRFVYGYLVPEFDHIVLPNVPRFERQDFENSEVLYDRPAEGDKAT